MGRYWPAARGEAAQHRLRLGTGAFFGYTKGRGHHPLIVVGQVGVVLGYALLPWAVGRLLRASPLVGVRRLGSAPH